MLKGLTNQTTPNEQSKHSRMKQLNMPFHKTDQQDNHLTRRNHIEQITLNKPD